MSKSSPQISKMSYSTGGGIVSSCSYKWEFVEEKEQNFVSFPVIFVNKPCFFQCSVQIGEHDHITIFDVSLIPETSELKVA